MPGSPTSRAPPPPPPTAAARPRRSRRSSRSRPTNHAGVASGRGSIAAPCLESTAASVGAERSDRRGPFYAPTGSTDRPPRSGRSSGRSVRRPGWADHAVHHVLERRGRVERESGVDRRRLDDRRARRDQPVEALVQRKAADRAGVRAAGADARCRLDVRPYLLQVVGRPERSHARLVELDPGAEEATRTAEEDRADVQELAAL